MAVTVPQQSHCGLSPLRQPQKVLLCVCARGCASECTRYVCESRVCCHRHTNRSRTAKDFFCPKQSLSLEATRKSAYSSSKAAAVQRQLCFKLLPLCQLSRCMYVVGAHQENKARQYFYAQTQRLNTHRRTSYLIYEDLRAAAKAVARTTYHWNACAPSFRLATPLGYQFNPAPKGNLVPYPSFNLRHPISIQPHREGEPCILYTVYVQGSPPGWGRLDIPGGVVSITW